MDVQGLVACAIFLVMVSPCIWYLCRQLDRMGQPSPHPPEQQPEAPLGDASDVDLEQLGVQPARPISEHVRRIEAEGVAYYEERFREAPLGSWHARDQEPTLTALYWEFRPDHTGEALETSSFGRPHRRTTFEWRTVSPFTIEILVTGRQTYLRATNEGTLWEDEARDPNAPPEEWERVEYTFTLLDSSPPDIVMHTPGSATFDALYFYSQGPLLLDWPC